MNLSGVCLEAFLLFKGTPNNTAQSLGKWQIMQPLPVLVAAFSFEHQTIAFIPKNIFPKHLKELSPEERVASRSHQLHTWIEQHAALQAVCTNELGITPETILYDVRFKTKYY